MKKTILYLMPIMLILALFGYWLGTNITLHGFLSQASKLNLQMPDIQKLGRSFNNLQFADIWGNVAKAWEDVYELITFFQAIGQTFVGIFQSIIEIGKMIYYTIEFLVEFITFIFRNFIDITTLMYNYLFNK